MCEGKTEVRLVIRLLEERLLSFGIKEVFDARPIHARQLVEFEAQLATVPYSIEIEVLRIGDTQRDELDLSRFSSRVADGLRRLDLAVIGQRLSSRSSKYLRVEKRYLLAT